MSCRRSFSQATSEAEWGQKKRRLNEPVRQLLISGVSQRQIARLLRVNLKTVARKLVFLSQQATHHHDAWIEETGKRNDNKLTHVQFDEMESSIHSKCLPVSIPLVVQEGTRVILGLDVCSMPAKGVLAAISRRKYGPRVDDRPTVAAALLKKVSALVSDTGTVTSDQNPKYPSWIKPHFPKAKHKAYLGRRGCVVGQGELKKIGFDPLFSLNHTAAMIRAHVNRMFRRTWCTSKRMDRLRAHLVLYMVHHNSSLGAYSNVAA